MLILTRKSGESIIVGENITATILEVSGIQVKIGIEAPKDIRIYRYNDHEGGGNYQTVEKIRFLKDLWG